MLFRSHAHIETREFDANRSLRSHISQNHDRSLLDDDVDFMGEVARGIIDRDRRRMKREFTRTISFVVAVLSWYVKGLTSHRIQKLE